VRLEVEGLEVAKGHDGFLRGKPEPVLVCGLFDLLSERASLIARGIGRFTRPKEFPSTVTLSQPTLLEGKRHRSGAHPLALVVMAMEEDNGGDIQDAYAMLQAHRELHVLETSCEPVALDIAELLRHPDHWLLPRHVDLLVDGHHFDQNCRKDKWISAAAFVIQKRAPHRVHLASTDGKNDWTALLELR
jgi:hypothetical protein